MANKTARNHIFQKKVGLEDKKFKVWLEEDGIVRIKAGKIKINEKVLEILGKDYKEIVKRLPAKPKILTDISMVQWGSTSAFRKSSVKFIKDMFEDPGFEKMAIWGGSMAMKVIISFVATATGLKNVKYFKTEEEALKWLKEED